MPLKETRDDNFNFKKINSVKKTKKFTTKEEAAEFYKVYQSNHSTILMQLLVFWTNNGDDFGGESVLQNRKLWEQQTWKQITILLESYTAYH